MRNKQGILIEPGNFYVDSFGLICYIEENPNVGLVYSDMNNHSSITLGGYADLLIAQIKPVKEQIPFILEVLEREKQSKLESSAQSLPKSTNEPVRGFMVSPDLPL